MIHNELNEDSQFSSVAGSNTVVLENTYTNKRMTKELNIYLPI